MLRKRIGEVQAALALAIALQAFGVVGGFAYGQATLAAISLLTLACTVAGIVQIRRLAGDLDLVERH